MIITNSRDAEPIPLGPYGKDEFFAFVESADELDKTGHDLDGLGSDWFGALLKVRGDQGLSEPTQFVWLDCVRANYFAELTWRGETCDINNAIEAARRRDRIASLDGSKFIVMPLLLSRHIEAERSTFLQLMEVSWHRVTIGTQAGLPVLVAPDFDLEPGERNVLNFRYEMICDEAERTSLTAVFNLNFLPDANLDDLERPDPQTPPSNPVGGAGLGALDFAGVGSSHSANA